MLGDDILNAAAQLRGTGDTTQWETGDFVASVVIEAAGRMRRSAVLKALAVPLGVSRQTANDLCQTAETFEPGMREQYSEALTFGHFREASRATTVAPTELLEWARAGGDDHGGTPAGVDALRRRVRELNAGTKEEPSALEAYTAKLARALDVLDDALALAHPSQRAALRLVMDGLDVIHAAPKARS